MATRQEVIFKGLTHSPSDYDCQDGELATCLNLINEDGALKPIHKPLVAEENITLGEGDVIEFVHKVTHNTDIHSHYIIRKPDDTWYWMEKGGNGIKNTIDLNGFHVNAITAVGNILCFIGDEKTMYAYWKDTSYVVMDFSTIKYSGSIIKENGNKTYDVIEPNNAVQSIDDHSTGKGNHYIKFKNKIDATAAQKLFSSKDSYLNKKMDDESFKYIQFGVLAIKLYDGSHIIVGNPFTITNGEGVDNNINLWYSLYDGSMSGVVGEGEKFSYSARTVYAIHLAQSLFKFKLSIKFNDIAKYEDIIDGIDVFVSNSIYPYKTNIELVEEQKIAQGDTSGDDTQKITINTEEYGELELRNIYIMGTIECLGHWSYPALSKDEFNEQVSNLSFYKSISFTFDDIVKKKQKKLKRVLQTEESLSLSSSFRDSYGAKCAITYNNRLHFANTSTTNRSTINGYVSTSSSSASIITHIKYKYNGNTLETYGVENLCFPLDSMLSFPNENVISFEVYAHYDEVYKHKKFDIYNKNNLGISFYTEYKSGTLKQIDFSDAEDITQEQWNEVTNTATLFKPKNIFTPSLVKVSEAENPLVFPAKNSVQVGSSVISALVANTRPISEGQFGEAPLYAFTDEGVWVLMLSEEGTYVARQPANRDICSNPKGILQIDDAVLYPTNRGIMMQQGRNSICITDQLDGYPFNFMEMRYANQIIATNGTESGEIRYIRFRDYLKSADMIYDYYDNRIIVFNPNKAYAYVYSLKSKMWGTMKNVFNKRVNIYPESYATNKEGKILNVYVEEPSSNTPYFLCSRPLSISDKDIHKTMFSCIARGYFRNGTGKCGLVLYGSNDLFNWFLIKTSVNEYLRGMAGSPYKYFRIALIGSLRPDESISGLSADFQERWQNKLR